MKEFGLLGGALALCFTVGRGGALTGRRNGTAECITGAPPGVIKQHWGQRLAHVPQNIRWRSTRSLLLLALAAVLAAQDNGAIRDALAAMQRGDFTAAEHTLRAEAKIHPSDAATLTLLGVTLDNQKKFSEAGEIHRRAAAAAPGSPDVLNNYANHLLGVGDEEGARKLYLRVVGLVPADRNGNVQLARIAVKQKHGAEALGYLKHLEDAPNLTPIRLAALYLAGQTAEAESLAERWLAAAKNDLGANFSTGLVLADAGRFEEAERFFSQALQLAPSDFNVLTNLGVVAWRAGHYQRAREVLLAAQRQQPQNPDVLYDLACVDQADHQSEAALPLLAQAARLAPQRSDVQKLLALAAGDVGALDDAAAAWDRYLKLEPDDDVARRERGFTAFQRGRFEQGVADLEWFAARHPNDAVGHFELGSAVNKDNPARALAEFDRALALQPDFAAAHAARGSLYYQMGKPEAALTDLEAAAARSPTDAVSLDRLGQTYLALDRAEDAVRVLKRAATLAPADSKTQLHLARALADAGQAAESKAAMDRFRQLGPVVNKGVPGGLVDYLSLTPEQRRADYRARVERVVREHPQDATAQAAYLRLLLEEGDSQKAQEVARKIAAMKPASGFPPDLQLDLAAAAFRTGGPAQGMLLLDQVPDAARSGDYYLARAAMLDAAGKTAEAAAALQQALRTSPGEASLYLRACALWLNREQTEDALRVSGEALKALPRERRILLLRALVLERTGRTEEALRLLEQIENRWPEWQAGWASAGVVLGIHGRRSEALAALRTAAALGSTEAEVKDYLNDIAAGAPATPPDLIRMLLSQPARDW